MPIHYKETFDKSPGLVTGNLQIIACAGSGKTEFVSERIAYQIFKGIARPEQIVAFTFTEKAAEELKSRTRTKIQELIGRQTDIGDMYIGTIHAFAYKILQEFIPRYRGFDMLDEVQRLAFLSSIRNDIDVNYLTNSLAKRFTKPYGRNHQNWTFTVFLRDIDLFREEGLKPEHAVSDSFRNAMEVYLQKLEEKRFIDFSGLLKVATDTLEDNLSIRKKIQAQYKFLTIDEYQDVNPIQEKLIQLISGKQNVCVVGDDDQSIYQWRGADVSNIISFKKRYTKVNIHTLEINRRSCDGIVRTAVELIKRNDPKRLSKKIKDKGIKSDTGDIYKIIFETQEEETEWLINKIQSLAGREYLDGNYKRKLKYSDIGILFRSIANEATPYITALQESDIPVIYSGTGGLFETAEVSGIRKILEFICEYDKDHTYDRAYLESIFQEIQDIFPVNFAEFIRGIAIIKNTTKSQKRLSLQGLYLKLLSLLGLANNNAHEQEDDVLLYNLGRFSHAITDYESAREYLTFSNIKDFLWFIRLHTENSYDSGNTDSLAGLIDAVQILTMHGTKGLGFPVVFMPGHFRKNRNPEFGPTLLDTSKFDVNRFLNHITDERRLYYVALTRAKKFLFVTSAEYKIGGQRKASRSNMFDEIPDAYALTSPVPDPTKRTVCSVDGISKEALFPTSYSELSYYLNCGYDYKMRFIYGFNPELVQALGFGKQVHNIINILHREFEDTNIIPSNKRLGELIEEHFYLRHASATMKQKLKTSAYKSLEKYIRMWENDFHLSVKTERPFELEFENSLIAGSIDMIKRQEKEDTILEVIDFKTGKPDNELMHRYELQVQLYSIAANEALGIDTQKALIHFLDADKNERLAVQTSAAALETAREELSYAVKGITTGKFKRDARQNKTCKQCDWLHICSKRKGYRP